MPCGCKKKGSGRKLALYKQGSGRGKKRKRAGGLVMRGSGIMMTGGGVPAKRSRKVVSGGRVQI